MPLPIPDRKIEDKLEPVDVRPDGVGIVLRRQKSHMEQTMTSHETPDAAPISNNDEKFAKMSRDELMAGITSVLVDALGLDDDEVVEHARLEGDLGAASIDYLDIRFRIEKKFGIKIPSNELFSIEDIVKKDDAYYRVDTVGRAFENTTYVTDEGMAVLRKKLPHLNFDQFAIDPNLAHASDVHTVGSLLRYLELRQGDIRRRLEQKSGGNSHVRTGMMP